jgi:1-acyl-sn-glycerol-3-phosphate acyltransferase
MSTMSRIASLATRLGARALAAGRVAIAVTGLEHIPADGPVLLVARHYHYLFDGVVLLVSIPRPIHILVTLDWVKNSYALRLLTLATTMARWPVVLRSGAARTCATGRWTWREKLIRAGAVRRYQRSALDDSVALLTEGRVLAVFPEGYPNIDRHYTPKTKPEEVLPFKAGFAAIAAAAERRQGSRVAIVPCGFGYTRNGSWTARLNIGRAVYLEDFGSRQLLVSYMEQRVAELSRLLQPVKDCWQPVNDEPWPGGTPIAVHHIRDGLTPDKPGLAVLDRSQPHGCEQP